jgi:hypothetical protein
MLIQEITTEKGFYTNQCRRGTFTHRDDCRVGSILCEQCPVLFRFQIGNHIICSGSWTNKDEMNLVKMNYKKPYGKH